jgi:benzylsuccinate CoA-transferase BbsF subunit
LAGSSVGWNGASQTSNESWLALAVETEAQWRSLCAIAGQADWLTDPRFASCAGRLANVDALDALIGGWTATRERNALVEELTAAGVVAAPVLDAAEIIADPALRQRGFVQQVEHPETGTWWQLTAPFRLSHSPRAAAFHAPLQGEHSAALLADWLCITPEEYAELERSSVSGSGPPYRGRRAGLIGPRLGG